MASGDGWVYRATVLRHIDADTIDALVDLGFRMTRHERFRLLGSAGGIDAPEMNDPDPAVRQRALQAKTRTQELCPVGSQVLLFTEKAPAADGFGRWLSQVINADGENVGDVLLREGLAVPYVRGR